MERKNKRSISYFLMTGGALLLAAALLLIGYNIVESKNAGAAAESVLKQMRASQPPFTGNLQEKTESPVGETKIPDYILNPNMELPSTEIDGKRYVGRLWIPALDLELPVMETLSYAQLKLSPCRYTGSPYLGNFIIAAHNYTHHFGNLNRLNCGDTVFFMDIDGNEFGYQVASIDTLAGTAVEEMQAGEWDLTLFTCTVGGVSRVTVRCQSINTVK